MQLTVKVPPGQLPVLGSGAKSSAKPSPLQHGEVFVALFFGGRYAPTVQYNLGKIPKPFFDNRDHTPELVDVVMQLRNQRARKVAGLSPTRLRPPSYFTDHDLYDLVDCTNLISGLTVLSYREGIESFTLGPASREIQIDGSHGPEYLGPWLASDSALCALARAVPCDRRRAQKIVDRHCMAAEARKYLDVRGNVVTLSHWGRERYRKLGG